MDKLIVSCCEQPLSGQLRVSGAKNAVLPILAGCILTDDWVTLHNIPHLRDVTTMIELLGGLGVEVIVGDRMALHVNARNITNYLAPYKLVKTMRASILVLGPLLARYGIADVSLPGGCQIGARPVDFHLEALQLMGAEIEIDEGYIKARAPNGLHGCHIDIDGVTVTGTENVMMAAVLAKGTTIINNAACEPEVEDLAVFLNSCGAQISGAGTACIVIDGVESLHGGEHTTIPDRIEAGTYLTAAALTSGDVLLKDADPDTMETTLLKFEETGAIIDVGDDWIKLDMQGRHPKAVNISTSPYPGFPTDMQAQFMTLNCHAQGKGMIIENVFENRFMHVQELRRLGADLAMHGKVVCSQGPMPLTGAQVMATDLRASASLVLAGLVAKGKTMVDRIYHIDRGYECIEEKLRQLGATIERTSFIPEINEQVAAAA